MFLNILSTLRRSRLIFWDSNTMIKYNSTMNSNTEKLDITFSKKSNNSVSNLLLIHMPKLKKLQISSHYSRYDNVSLFTEQLFFLQELQTFKLTLKNGLFKSHCLSCLHTTMPVLKQFHFDCSFYLMTDDFIEYFVYHWWSIIEQFIKIYISIKDHIAISTNDNNTQTISEKYRQILIDKNNQIEESFQIQWEEKFLTTYKLITITIVRS